MTEIIDVSIPVYAQEGHITITQELGMFHGSTICIRRHNEFLFFDQDEEDESTLHLVMAVPIPKKHRKRRKRH